jgi:hypothetical protein
MEISDPASALPSKSGSSALAVLIALSASLLLGFFACSVVAISRRWSRGPERPTAFEPAVAAAAALGPPQALRAPASTSRTATVILRPPHTTAKMHTAPAVAAPGVAEFPAGTVVEVETSRRVQGPTAMETWYQARVVVRGVAYEGWMHQNVLRMD